MLQPFGSSEIKLSSILMPHAFHDNTQAPQLERNQALDKYTDGAASLPTLLGKVAPPATVTRRP